VAGEIDPVCGLISCLIVRPHRYRTLDQPMDRFRPHHAWGPLSLPDGRYRAVSSREFDAVPALPRRPPCDHRALIRVTGCKPFLTMWVD
jgi:hypothetical protein